MKQDNVKRGGKLPLLGSNQDSPDPESYPPRAQTTSYKVAASRNAPEKGHAFAHASPDHSPDRGRTIVLGEPINPFATSGRVTCSATIHHNDPHTRPCRARAVTMYEGRAYCISHRPQIAPPSGNDRKRAAREAVNYAIRTGAMQRQSCEVGQDCDGPVEAHHEDYDRPLDVQWLCRRHHQAIHPHMRPRVRQ